MKRVWHSIWHDVLDLPLPPRLTLSWILLLLLTAAGAASLYREFQAPAFYVERIWSYSGVYACRHVESPGRDAFDGRTLIYHLQGDRP